MVDPLLTLSHAMGREDRQLAILGEGNASCLVGDGTFWIKASGGSLATLDRAGVTQVQLAPVLAAVDGPALDDAAVRELLLASRCDPGARLPSVETFMHAICFAETGCTWIGHCHPTAVLGILCSQQGARPFLQHMFPDAIVVCGAHVAVVPYVDPGLPLARAVRDELRRFADAHGQPPKVLLLENHGPVALAQSDRETLSILLMLDKWARVITATYAFGGPQYLSPESAGRIDNRPDEHYRRRQLGAQ